MTVTILPKMWTPRLDVIRTLTHEPGAITHAVAYERDFLRLVTSTAAVSGILSSLAEVSGVGQAQLLGTCAPPEGRHQGTPALGSPFAELLTLASIAERSGVRRDEGPLTGRLDKGLTRLLMHERFLRLLEPMLFRARPRYVESTEELTAPKGRLHDKSLLLAESTGRPWVVSTFDDLTMDTPLLRVVLAALGAVSGDRLPNTIRALSPQVGMRAIQFAHHLAPVTQVSREHGLILGERLWLSALERQWRPVLDAAVEVLRQYGPTPADGNDNSDSFAVHVFTEKFWEQVLHELLTAAFGEVRLSADRSPGAGVVAPAPWMPPPGIGSTTGDSDTYPDFMFRAASRVIVADAKYKRTRRISAADGYQLFSYSHLATLDGKSSELALLLYPSQPGALRAQDRWTRRPAGDYALQAVRIPFPSREDLATSQAWGRYIAKNAAALRDLADEWAG